ncbi:MAG TPA: tetratricopeptide repeat protein [Terracidiphilus sp.]
MRLEDGKSPPLCGVSELASWREAEFSCMTVLEGICYCFFDPWEIAMRAVRHLLFVPLMTAVAFAQATVDAGVLAKANGGDASAQVAAGEAYAKAGGGATDPDDATENWNKAAGWYQKAAEQAYVPGEIHLAECYTYGRGVARDKGKAAEWYRKAAEQGDGGAQGTLAMLYTMGQGVAQDDAEAYFWFDLAASADTPSRERYLTNRQNVGTRITADQLADVQRRLKKWKAEHAQAAPAK